MLSTSVEKGEHDSIPTDSKMAMDDKDGVRKRRDNGDGVLKEGVMSVKEGSMEIHNDGDDLHNGKMK